MDKARKPDHPILCPCEWCLAKGRRALRGFIARIKAGQVREFGEIGGKTPEQSFEGFLSLFDGDQLERERVRKMWEEV